MTIERKSDRSGVLYGNQISIVRHHEPAISVYIKGVPGICIEDVAMNGKNLEREIDQVVKRVLRLARKHSNINKKEFEGIHAEIQRCLHENTRISMDAIAEKMDVVLGALSNEYGRLPEEQRSWEALIAYLYVRYLKELGRL